MNPTFVGLAVTACTFVGALAGHWLRATLPEHHLDDDAKDTVKLGAGLIATITALVLGLVTASAKSAFDEVDTAVKHTAGEILALDRLLARYGPETAELRGALKRSVGERIEVIWPSDSSRAAPPDPLAPGGTTHAETVADGLRRLTPKDDFQRALQARALDLAEEILQARWLVFAAGGTSVPPLFVVILAFWLTITFTSFGLFAPRNATVLAVLFICSVSVGSSLFLILEMDQAFSGVLQVSAEPMRYAYAHLDQ